MEWAKTGGVGKVRKQVAKEGDWLRDFAGRVQLAAHGAQVHLLRVAHGTLGEEGGKQLYFLEKANEPKSETKTNKSEMKRG